MTTQSNSKNSTTFHIVLFEPEIPPNTGNIIRLCSNTSAMLHIIEPMGFELDNARLKRAGLDYHEWSSIQQYPNFNAFLLTNTNARCFTLSTKSEQCYTDINFEFNDYFIFGPETRGLPLKVFEAIPKENHLTIPMMPYNRSLNLSNSVSIVLYEAWRQKKFQTPS